MDYLTEKIANTLMKETIFYDFECNNKFDVCC